MLYIRHFEEQDWPQLWPILQATFASGDTYAFAPDSSEADIYQAWVKLPLTTYVASDIQGRLLGTYVLKANQPGLGNHVCNCGYVVALAAQGQGVASQMCEHSQQEALAQGFRAMQFNLVVATNKRAVDLWQHLGFDIVGTLPGAFQHQKLGFVDAFVMFKTLANYCSGPMK
jgi:GNAT superfamily N-acetyltransferase